MLKKACTEYLWKPTFHLAVVFTGVTLSDLVPRGSLAMIQTVGNFNTVQMIKQVGGAMGIQK